MGYFVNAPFICQVQCDVKLLFITAFSGLARGVTRAANKGTTDCKVIQGTHGKDTRGCHVD